MLESTIEKQCKKYTEKRGGQLLKLVSPSRRGWPDRMLIYPGHPPVFIEFKTPTGRVSKLQQYTIDNLLSAGYGVWIVRSKEQYEELLTNYLGDEL